MEQPAGTVEGSLTLYRPDGLGGGEWWQVTRHTLLAPSGALANRTKYWERIFKSLQGRMHLVGERQTDDLWGRETADEWIDTQVQNRLRSGFRPSQLEGAPGPQQLTELLKRQLAQPGTQDDPRK